MAIDLQNRIPTINWRNCTTGTLHTRFTRPPAANSTTLPRSPPSYQHNHPAASIRFHQAALRAVLEVASLFSVYHISSPVELVGYASSLVVQPTTNRSLCFSPPSSLQTSQSHSLAMSAAVASTMAMPPPSSTVSTIRRKPILTYQSPSSHYTPPSLRIETPARTFSRAQAMGSASSSSSTSSSVTTKAKRNGKKVVDGGVKNKEIVQKPKSTMNPPLPLYHPLGRLALSLPDLDPATIGLTLPTYAQDDARRSSGRTRRPAAKLREVEDEAETVPIIASALTGEVKDKVSPKKKGGARPGAGMKRKRKDPDEDATYPAKKTTRQPRGATRFPTSPPDGNPPVPSSVEIANDAQEEKRPERRSTRSARGSLLRRDSSASEATATSVSVSIAAAVNGKHKSPYGSPEAEKPVAEDHDKDVDMVAE